MFEVDESAAKSPLQKLQALITSPMAMYELMDGANRDPTFSPSLPNEPIRLFLKHMHDIYSGFYMKEVKGALNSPAADRWNWENFHENGRVRKRFLEDFNIAYDSISNKKKPQEEKGKEEESKE